MQLRIKASIIIVITLGVMFGLTYFIAQKALKENYQKLESRYIETNVKRVKEIIEDVISEISRSNKDWSSWDETYFFIDRPTRTYLKANMSPSPIKAINIDLVMIFNRQGKKMADSLFKPNSLQKIDLPQEISTTLSPKSEIIQKTLQGKVVNGLIKTPSDIFLISSQPVLRGDSSGPVNGVLIMGNYFNEDILDRIKKTSRLDIVLYKLDYIKNHKKLQDIYNFLIHNQKDYREISHYYLNAYYLLHDLHNQPVGILRITIPRVVYLAQINTIRYFSFSFLGFGIIFGILLFYLVHRFIVLRLERLNKEIISIGEKPNFSKRLTRSGNDEISSVAECVNNLLNIIQQSNIKQKNLYRIASDAKKFQKKILDAIPSTIIITDKNFRIKLINKFAKIKFHKQEVDRLLTEEFSFIDEIILMEAIATHRSKNIDRLPVRVAGKMSYYSISIFPLKSGKEEFLGVRIDDVSEQVKLEEKITENNKLVSLGVLTAGIAHEINNPVNFISGTVKPLNDDVTDVLKLLEKYQELDPSTDINQFLKEVSNLKKELDINYTITEIKKLLEAINEGAKRTATIVKDLRIFSRQDQSEKEKVNINAIIDTTLTLLIHHYKNKVVIKKDYEETLPLIEFNSGKISQVIMNILSNSIDAIKKEGEIIIKTSHDENFITISIKDNGCGMSEEIKKKVFEPFFTTKEVGKGTGLGLSISFGIIHDAGGTIEVESQVGLGTEFSIVLPIKNSLESSSYSGSEK